jgi:hypothetical protein
MYIVSKVPAHIKAIADWQRSGDEVRSSSEARQPCGSRINHGESDVRSYVYDSGAVDDVVVDSKLFGLTMLLS